ncbi:13422_t:CDS:2 [Acaulospora colombiana]|uniref:13422_t:CDS:1 n=1 Tax=Acaulospora colombiana TaxID=27376 RepID=A0ACA9M460_9GLOM|nr:13422_t:CDS:2 [Acaulospora colombiana]
MGGFDKKELLHWIPLGLEAEVSETGWEATSIRLSCRRVVAIDIPAHRILKVCDHVGYGHELIVDLESIERPGGLVTSEAIYSCLLCQNPIRSIEETGTKTLGENTVIPSSTQAVVQMANIDLVVFIHTILFIGDSQWPIIE